jgi:hypothetical protein
MKSMRAALAVPLIAALAFAADYRGPRPQKTDTLYLQHADNLVELEAVTAKREGKKDDSVYTVPGASSPAKTPLAEPIFLLKSDRITPESVELYRFDVKNGHREVTLSNQRRRNRGGHPYYLSVTRLEQNLYKIEASEPLENGEYGLSPTSSDQVFCFSVY